MAVPSPRRIVPAYAWAAAALLASAAGAGEPPRPPAGDAPGPAKVIVIAPGDVDAFWKRLEVPDFIWMTGQEFRKRLEAAAARPAAPPRAAVVDLAVGGAVEEDLAHLAVDLTIEGTGDDPAWVPIRLDGLGVTRAAEGGRELPLRQAEGAGWQVELRGAGRHAVRVELLAPVTADAGGRSLALAIPEAPSTRVALDVPAGATGALANGRVPVAAEPVGDGRARLTAHLPARPLMELTWHAEADPGAGLPPLLAGRGEIAMDVDRGAIHVNSSWSVRAERGSVKELELRLDPGEELLELTLDGRPLPIEGRRDPATGPVRVPLLEPLRPGAAKRLTLTTRRPLPAGEPARWTYSGLPIARAAAQSGVLAVSQGEGLWLTGIAGRDLIQIDPRGELPDTLRRPSTVLAYHFLAQPFELALQADPAPPLVRASARTTVAVDLEGAAVDTWVDYRATPGRAFEVRVAAPPGLDLRDVGPADVVESSRRLGDAVAVRIKTKARDEGAFRVHLAGRQALAPSARVGIGLFRPDDSDGAKVAVLAARGVSAELAEDPDGFLPMPPPADWPVPPDRPDGVTWLRHGGSPALLPLRIAALTRSVRFETAVAATLGRTRLDTRQETACRVRNGTLAHVDVAVPPDLEGRWEVEGLQVSGQARVGPGPGGSTIYRLTLRPPGRESPRLLLRTHQALASPLEADRPRRVEVPILRLLDGSDASTRVEVAADGDIDLDPIGPGWSPAAPPADGATTAAAAPARWSWAGDEAGGGGPGLQASAPSLATLPPLVASRLWIRTVLLPDGGRRVSASYRVEVHATSLALRLPPGATWVGAQVDGLALATVERLPDPGRFRLRLPAGPAPTLVGVEYLIPRGGPDDLVPPALLEGGVVQHTLWEVRVPWSRAAVGVPPGWTDENSWSWDRYVWKRRPWKDPQALASWVATPSARPTLPDDADDGGRGDYHGYLFGRPGDPVPLPLWVASRSGLVGLFSGGALGLGLLLLVGRRPTRGWPAALGLAAMGLALAVATALQPSVTLLAVQSAAIGVALTSLAALTRWLVDRGRPRRVPIVTSSASASGSGLGTTPEPPGRPGSDHSTIIRPRAASTVDYPSPLANAGPTLEGAG